MRWPWQKKRVESWIFENSSIKYPTGLALACLAARGDERMVLALDLTEADMRSAGPMMYPGLSALKLRAMYYDPYVWRDPFEGAPSYE